MRSCNDNPEKQDHRVQTGKTFEHLAGRFFVQNGFEILERNWRTGHREIDLIVKKDNLIVFVEVKSASSQKFGHPANRVDNKKVANLTRAAQQYLIDHSIENHDLRFDVVTYVQGKLEHFPNAFPAGE
ncbi:MAG: YraN family protein [bacterium]